jgi:hypothetical protein
MHFPSKLLTSLERFVGGALHPLLVGRLHAWEAVALRKALAVCISTAPGCRNARLHVRADRPGWTRRRRIHVVVKVATSLFGAAELVGSDDRLHLAGRAAMLRAGPSHIVIKLAASATSFIK